VPHSARIWNYWLGGTDNYPVDRAAGDAYIKIYPKIVDIARAGRAFLARAVRYLTLDAGIRQIYQGTNQIQRVVMARRLLK